MRRRKVTASCGQKPGVGLRKWMPSKIGWIDWELMAHMRRFQWKGGNEGKIRWDRFEWTLVAMYWRIEFNVRN